MSQKDLPNFKEDNQVLNIKLPRNQNDQFNFKTVTTVLNEVKPNTLEMNGKKKDLSTK